MAEETIGNTILWTCFASIPSPNDPVNAREFYEALGMATIAWGRLEGNFNNMFVTVLNIADDPQIGLRFYIKREAIGSVWNLAFEKTSALSPFKDAAKTFLSQMEELSDFRDHFTHGLWGPFESETPLTMRVAKLKPRDSIGGMWYSHGTINVNNITTFIIETNRLNETLYCLADKLFPLRGEAPQDAHRP
jgi:hypothetical protein